MTVSTTIQEMDFYPQNKEKQYVLSSLGKGYLPQFLEDKMHLEILDLTSAAVSSIKIALFGSLFDIFSCPSFNPMIISKREEERDGDYK